MTSSRRPSQDGAGESSPGSGVTAGLRAAAVGEALASVGSPDYRVRATAGAALATVPDLTSVTETLHLLLLDPEDTWVTATTAGALLARGDTAGTRVVLEALARAAGSHLDVLSDAVLYPRSAQERDQRRSVLRELCRDADTDVARAAFLLLEETR